MQLINSDSDFPAIVAARNSSIETLARENAAHSSEVVEAPFLIFRLGASLFGVPALSVREIHALAALSPLPETAPFILGVFDLRGAFVPVMDLGARIGESAAPYRLSDNLIVLNHDGADVAILVNEVLSVERLAPAQIEAAPAFGRPHDLTKPFIAGVAHLGDDFVMLLHLTHLLHWPAAMPNSSTAETLAPRFDLQNWTCDERAILAARAARLRLVTENKDENNNARAPVAILSLGDEEMGIDLSVVREFVSVDAAAPVPCCPPHILGQINLRGDIVTLVDVRVALRTARIAPPYFDAARESQSGVTVVVVDYEGAPVGIAVDEVRDVLYLQGDERLPLNASTGSGGHNGKYFAGGALHQGRLLPLLDVARLLAESDLEVDESV